MKSSQIIPMHPDDRGPVLVRARNMKMARSAHAYVRGSTSRFYELLGSGDARVVPDGPAIWICGDCHAGNLGPVANAEGKIAIQIRDFDQTVIGNPAHDLIRLGLSLATAVRGSDLPGVTTARMLEQMIEGYGSALEENVHWDGLKRFLEDGRIELDNNSVERAMRPTKLSAKNSLFAGSDEGGANWSLLASLVETCKLNQVNPQVYFADLLTRLVNRWPQSRIDELMPWHWVPLQTH